MRNLGQGRGFYTEQATWPGTRRDYKLPNQV
jgi:hypothetical protein